MKIWLKLTLAMIIGILAGIFIPGQISLLELILKTTSDLVINLLLYFTLAYVLIKTYLGALRLKEKKIKISKIIFIFFCCVVVSLTFSIIVSIGLMNLDFFQPNTDLSILQAQTIMLENFTIIDLLKKMINQNLFTVFQGPLQFILPAIVLSLILSHATYYTSRKNWLFVDFIESLDEIIQTIIIQILDYFYFGAMVIVGALFYQAKDQIFQSQNLNLFLSSFFTIISVALILILFYLIFLNIVFKKNVIIYLLGILGAGFFGLITGNTASAIIPLNEHLTKNIGINKNIAHFLTPLGMVINRCGTVIVTAIILLSSILVYSPNNLSLSLQISLFFLLFVFSFTLDGINQNAFFVLASLVLSSSSLYLEENSYLIFLAFVPLLSRFAVFIDVMTTGIFIIICAKSTDQIKTVEYKEFI